MNNKKTVLTILVIAIVLTIIGGTFAWLTWRSNKMAMMLTIGEENGMSVTLKPYQLDLTIMPVNDYTDVSYINVTASNNTNSNSSFNLFYVINDISSYLIDEGFKYTITKSTDNGVSYEEVDTGDFSQASTNENFIIFDDIVPGDNTTYLYRVYLWLDGSVGNQSNVQGETFKGELRAEIFKSACSKPAKPVLDEGMIPVKISDNGVVTALSQNNSTWYDYCEKEWANVVLVKENGVKTRTQNMTPGTVINSDDILAYYVWIPRYKYAFPEQTCGILPEYMLYDHPECIEYSYTYTLTEQEITNLLNYFIDQGWFSTMEEALEAYEYEYENGYLADDVYYYNLDNEPRIGAMMACGLIDGVNSQVFSDCYEYSLSNGDRQLLIDYLIDYWGMDSESADLCITNEGSDWVGCLPYALDAYNQYNDPDIVPLEVLKPNEVVDTFRAIRTVLTDVPYEEYEWEDPIPVTIDIVFESARTEKSLGTAVGDDYRTHPSFTFGAKELDGIWVGKFETSHNTLFETDWDYGGGNLEANNLGCSDNNCTNTDGLRILPNEIPITNNDVSNFFYAARSMEKTNNIFGITSSDSHMMKNSEWGAVAYLSHSKYGINDNVEPNSGSIFSSDFPPAPLTGCGYNQYPEYSTESCVNAYGSGISSYLQSTTGNISGVFDMSGDAAEYVMGMFIYNNIYSDSDGFNSLPDSKYYDFYSNYDFEYEINCNINTCGGHALYETADWYGNAYEIQQDDVYVYPWFIRGYGIYGYPGVFDAFTEQGSAIYIVSFRSVLTPK